MNGFGRIKYAIKIVIAYFLYYTGLLQLWQRVACRGKAVVLMYHRVLSPEEMRRTGSHPAIIVSSRTFEKQMAALKRKFVVLSVEQFAAIMKAGKAFPAMSCLITFDDGWLDNHANALPILERHGLPAVIFLPVHYVGARRLFWQEALTHLLTRAVNEAGTNPARAAELRDVLSPAGLDHVLSLDADNARPVINAAVVEQKRKGESCTAQLLAALAAALGVKIVDLGPGDGFLSWDQVQRMCRGGVAFGGHGTDHRLLTDIRMDEAIDEIRESIDVITRRTNPPVPTFSYPNGNWNHALAGEVRAAGYQLAFTTEGGFVSAGDDPFALRRININEASTDSVPMFLARVAGLF